MSPVVIQSQFAPVTDSVSQSRHLLDGFEDLIPLGKLDHLRLLVSELVTNSVVHAGLNEDHKIGLYVSLEKTLEKTLVSVKVRDSGVGFEKPRFIRRPEVEGSGGFGLYLVDSLVERWGVDSKSQGSVNHGSNGVYLYVLLEDAPRGARKWEARHERGRRVEFLDVLGRSTSSPGYTHSRGFWRN